MGQPPLAAADTRSHLSDLHVEVDAGERRYWVRPVFGAYGLESLDILEEARGDGDFEPARPARSSVRPGSPLWDWVESDPDIASWWCDWMRELAIDGGP